jgi:chaperone modulatory protein CbpM
MAFSEVDLALAKLIRDLTRDLGVNGEGVGVILDRVDQVHGLRMALTEVLRSAHERSALHDAGSRKGKDQDLK